MRKERSQGELGPLLRLSIPAVIAQFGQIMLGVVDAAFAGRLSVEALDAATLGNVWQLGTMMPLAGVVTGLGPLVSQAHGGRRTAEVALALQRALLIAGALSLPVMISWWYAREGLLLLGQDPKLAALAGEYVRMQLFSAPAYLLYSALSTYLSSRGIVRIGIVTMLVANAFNALTAWTLMFGHLGFPALGLRGAALATGLTEILLPCVTVLLIVRYQLHRDGWIPWSRLAIEWRSFRRQLALGLPNGLTLALELWAFQVGTILAGKLDPVALGAHAIALNLASLSFMVPLGFSIGTSAHVGQLMGSGERERAQRAANTVLKLLSGYALCAGGLFIAARELLPNLYSGDPHIAHAVGSILPIAGAFQLFDALQAAGSGVLRGMGRPATVALFNLIGYFAIGIPLAVYLSLHTALALRGIWIGYAVGLGFVAAGIVVSVLWRGPRTVKPLLWQPAE
jgi:MATE family multidrug resistance protein